MRIIIPFGKPGAGKGTLVEKIVKTEKWEVLSTGNALRQAVKENSEIGIKAQSYMKSGKLVPDEIVVECVKDALESFQNSDAEGIILDGFPRNISQAKTMLELGIIPTKVLVLNVSDETVIERLSARVECEKCKAPFSLLNNKLHPKKEGVCDYCGSKLIQRDDDKPEVVKMRLMEYSKQTAPVLEEFKNMNIPIVETSSDIETAEIKVLLS